VTSGRCGGLIYDVNNFFFFFNYYILRTFLFPEKPGRAEAYQQSACESCQ